ncbi:MAG: acyl-CoA thioesterase [Acidilobaceae archaeon]
MAIFSYRSRAYWSETDAAGIVHFSNFFRYCERAEEEFFKSILGGFPGLLDKHGVIVPRVRASCSYSSPIFPHDDFRVDIVDIVLGRKSISYKFEVYNESKGNTKSAECEVTVAIVNPSIMKSVEIPEALRSLLKTLGARDKELIGDS